jgi:hypothetical protein
MLCESKITEIYFIIDEFCKNFEKVISAHSLKANTTKSQRDRVSRFSQSEVMTILVLFHYGSFKNLKHFYLHYVQEHMKNEFPQTVSYNRFVELQKKAIVPLGIFLKTLALGKCTGISFIDSTTLRVCHIILTLIINFTYFF